MGNLLRVGGLGLFGAIGIASAVSVATHLGPAGEPSTLGGTEVVETGPARHEWMPRAASPIVMSSSHVSPRHASPDVTPRSSEHLRVMPSKTVTDHDASPTASGTDTATPSGSGSSADRRVVAPDLIAPAIPIVVAAPAISMSNGGSSPHDDVRPRENPARATPAVSRFGDGLPSQDALVANYQPLVTAHFDLLRDVIQKLERTQAETSLQMAKLQDDQHRRSLPAEEIPLVPQSPVVPSQKPNVSMKDNKLTLIFDDAEIKAVLNAIGTEAGLNILTSDSVKGSVSATLSDVEVKTALDAVLKSRGLVSRQEGNIVYVGTHDELHFVQHGGDLITTRVYRPNYVTAGDLQILITPLLSTTGKVTVSRPAEVGIAPDSASAGGDAFTGEEVLMVRDFAGILSQIDELVIEVDTMPRQVAIEAMILSVTLDDRNEMGVDFELLRQQDTLRITSGTPLVDLAASPFNDGLKIGFLDSSVFMFLNALETIGDTNVVASPRVMCLNKQRAEILIGSQLGYVSTTITETAATQAVEFLEVGTQLSIRPFISSQGMIRMEVHPELSTGSVRVESGFTLPDKEVTQVTTNVMCPDGATVVIGGLIREDLLTSSTQIPFLGNLPWVGPVFRQRREEIDRREIIVLLTPRIIQEADLWTEGQAYSNQFKDRRSVFLDKMDPVGKRYLAERHLRKARAAWAAGDVDQALRYCNMAIHFDPLHRDAIALRGELLDVAPDLETSVHDHLRHGLDPGNLPHHDYSKQGYPWRKSDLEPEAIHIVPSEEVVPIELPVNPPVHTIEIGPPPLTSAPR